jgi:hypothetical protein
MHLGEYIEAYISLNLSYSSDILPAFQGVIRRYAAETGRATALEVSSRLGRHG